jgi:signal transduction histidine kinase
MPRLPIDALKHAEILLEGQNRILEMVASARPMDSVLRSLCRLFEAATPGSSSSVVISDLSGSKVEMVVAPRLPKAFTKALAGRPVGREGDPSTMAMHRRTPVIVTDVEHDPAWAASGWREFALDYGLRSSSSTPVLSPEGQSVGAFSVYWQEPRTRLEEHDKLIRQITHLASLAIERGRAAEALRSSDHLARGQLETLTRTLAIMAKESNPDRLLEHVLATIAGQLGAHSIAVCEYLEGEIVRIATCGNGRLHFLTPEELQSAPRQPVATQFHPIWSEFFEHGSHCVVAEIDRNPRLRLAGVPDAPSYESWPSAQQVPSAYGEAMQKMRAAGVVASLAVPLFVEGRVTSLLNIRFRTLREFSREELALTQALAHQAMLALQLLRLARHSRDAAVEAERNRIARDIHDTLAQGFTGVIIQLEAAKRAMKRRALAKARKRVGRAQDLARLGLGEARRSVLALRPQSLEGLPLRSALEDLFTRMTLGSGLRAEFEVLGAEPPLAQEWKEVLLRVAQESLTNTIKHAHARTFTATLTDLPDETHLDLIDDGSGFDPHLEHEGFGLVGMKERIDQMGGQFLLRSAKGNGTRIHITLRKPRAPGANEHAADV